MVDWETIDYLLIGNYNEVNWFYSIGIGTVSFVMTIFKSVQLIMNDWLLKEGRIIK